MDFNYVESICFVARTKVVIPIQLATHLFENDVIKANDLLEEMRLQLGWLGKLPNFKVPDKYGGGIVDVYYLTEDGAAAVKKFDEDLFKGIGTVGKPVGRRRAMIVHDLYINKSLLWMQKYVDIEKYESEKILRREIFIQKLKNGTLRNNSGKPLSMGDFRIEYKRKTEKREFGRITCEVALTLNYEQVEGKPDGLWWFVSNDANADLISEVKGEKARRICNLGSINSATYPEKERQKQIKLFQKRLENQKFNQTAWKDVLFGLKKLGGAGTATAVATIIKRDRTAASRVLSEMESEGLLFSQGVQMFAGEKVGARKKLFILGNNGFLDLSGKKHFLNISEWVTALVKHNYFFQKYEPENFSSGNKTD